MADIESKVRSILESWGFSVEKIPETNRPGGQTPDFIVNDALSTYFVEVKTRQDDPAKMPRRDELLMRGELFEELLPLARSNTVSRSLSDFPTLEKSGFQNSLLRRYF
jgi:Holliday junction resolvase